MKNKLTYNIGLKVASVFLAVVLWLVVTSINNPTTSRTFYNIPVTLLHTELITDSGQVYEVLDGTDMISKVTVRASHSVFTDLSAENIIATADVGELSSLDTISIKLSTNVPNKGISSITGNIDTVKLKIEAKRSKALTLKATTSGNVEDGYLIGDITTDQNLVRISGPQSVVDQVAKASVDVNVTGITNDIVTNGEVKLYDSENKEIADTSKITQNIKTIGVKVSIWQKKAVPVNFTVSGKAAAGYRATGVIEGSGTTVEIAGKASALRNISSIEIPAEALDITDRTENLVKEIDVRQYLPDNVFLANSEDTIRTVTVHIEPERVKRLELREEKIRMINLPEGYDIRLEGMEDGLMVEIVGLSQDVAEFQPDNITGIVDVRKWMQQQGMEEIEPGNYTLPVEFELPENLTLREAATVTLHVERPEEE